MISESRARFFESLEQEATLNVRFWSVFKLSDKGRSVSQQMSIPFSSQNTATWVVPGRKVVSSSDDITKAFNQHFTSVFSSDIEESRQQLAPIRSNSREFLLFLMGF